MAISEVLVSDYSISQAKDNLPQLIRQAEAGHEVRMTRRGSPVAVLVSAQRYDELTAERAGFTERYRSFREELLQDAIDLEPDEVFAAVRDRSPGRGFAW